MRDYAFRCLSAFYTGDVAMFSPARLPAEPLHVAVRVATSGAAVRDCIGAAGRLAKPLAYVLPELF